MIEQVFDALLDSLHVEGQQEWEGAWETQISDSLEVLRAAYDGLTVQGREEIDYSDSATQAAYVFAYAIGRAEFTYQLLMRYRKALGAPIFPEREARITSLGGGPGSELAGIVKYILDERSGENVESINYWVFDKDDQWSSVCKGMVDLLNDYIPIDLDYGKLNICNTTECSKLSLSGGHLLVLSFVISELCALEERDRAIISLREIHKTLDDGAKIFYNDSNAASFFYFFNDTKRFVKGLGKDSEILEIAEKITADFKLGETYLEFCEFLDAYPHSTSNALSKFLVRQLK